MAGKKGHKPRDPGIAGTKKAGSGRKSTGQTTGHFERDTKRGKGHFTGAGDAPMMLK